MASTRGPRDRRASFRAGSLMALSLPVLLLGACNVPLIPSAASPTPVVVTVVVTVSNEVTPTEPPSTEEPATAETVDAPPTLTFTPPPRPAPPRTSAGTPEGDHMGNFRIKMDFNPDYFLRVYVFYSEDPNEQFKAKKDGRGIDSVHFNVAPVDGSTAPYDRTERTAGYCAFGGGEPECNPWTFEDGQYRWGSGGPPVVAGSYNLTVTVTPDNGGDAGNWHWGDDQGNPIQITVP